MFVIDKRSGKNNLGWRIKKDEKLQTTREFPQEHLIELVGLSPDFVGRIVLYRVNDLNYDAEIDIVQSETGKIYAHVKSIHNQTDPRDLLDISVHHLKKFVEPKKH